MVVVDMAEMLSTIAVIFRSSIGRQKCPLRTTSVRNWWQAARAPWFRPPHACSPCSRCSRSAANGPARSSPIASRSAPARSAATSTSCARSATRSRPRPGVAGGYRLGAGGELPPLLLDDAEAVAVAVGLRTAASGSIAGIEETSVRALAKLEQVLPARLRRRVSALGDATSAFALDGPRIDADVLATLAGACRDGTRLHFAYVAQDDEVEPAQHRAARRRLQRLPLVPGRLRPRPRRLAHLPHRPDPGTGPRGRPRPPADRARRRPRRVRPAAAARTAGPRGLPCPGRVRLELPARGRGPADPGALRDRRARRRGRLHREHARALVARVPGLDGAARRSRSRCSARPSSSRRRSRW